MARLHRRLRDLFAPASRDRDLQQELQLHLEALVQEYRDSGLSDEAAEQAARRRFGSIASIKDRGHDVRGVGVLEDLVRETRHAARRLLRAPAFTLAAVATLALAIGANAAIFTVVHRVVLNPLPYPDSDRLIDLDHAAPGANFPSGGLPMTLGLYFHYGERARTLEAIAILATSETTLTGSGEPERIRIARATPTLDAVLRVRPLHGRWFTPDEAEPGGPLVAVLSHGLWMRRYGGDPEILGWPVSIDGLPAEVIGVMPPSFAFPDPQVDLWAPVQSGRQMVFSTFSHRGVARLRDGTSVADLRAELTGLIAGLPEAYPEDPGARGLADNARLTSVARPLQDAMVGGVTRVLSVLLGAVAFVLLVACANVANLFLVRSEARQRELAVRRALGAGRAALVRYFLAESASVSAAGGVLGLALAWGAVRLLVAASPANVPRLEEVRLDGIVVAFTVVLTFVAALAFGAIPFLRTTSVVASLHERGRGNTASASRHRMRHLLMGGQVALALTLFVAAGLVIRSFQNLRAIDPGFDPSAALTFRIGLPDTEYPDTGAAVRAHHAILDGLSAIPGVIGASASTRIPLAAQSRGFTSAVGVEGRIIPEGAIPVPVGFLAVAGGYFDTMGTPVVRGRGIDRGDVERHELVAVVNEAFVRVYFPNQDPIGARVGRGTGPVNSDWLTIVGVVADMPLDELPDATPAAAFPEIFMPMSISGPQEAPDKAANGPPVDAMSYVVRSAMSPLGLPASVRSAIDAVDRNLAISQVRTLEDLVDGASAQMAFTMVLLAIAASVALLLGLVGIYGVVSYIVSQRTNEIGVRLALGAEPRGVSAMIVRQGGLVALAGIAAGLGAALAGSRLIESLLYDVSPRDPVVFVATALTLLGVALLACWLPARRAARVSPVEALRAD